MNQENPALQASRRSWHCVMNGLKEEWLGLMADDVCIEDPIGKTPLDPVGEGHHGKEAVGRFWDTHIGPNTLHVEAQRTWTAGREVAHLLTITTTMATGQKAIVEGIFTYAVNDAGKLQALRGYWDMSNLTLES